MTKEEFILTRLRDERRMYRGLFIVCAAAALGAVALAVAAAVSIGITEALYGIGLAAGMVSMALGFRASANSLSRALQEVESDVEGLEFPEDYSVPTTTAIEKLMLPAKTYVQVFIAYAVLSMVMLAGAVVIVVLVEGDKALMALGLLLLLGAVLIGILAFKSFRNWKAAKQFSEL